MEQEDGSVRLYAAAAPWQHVRQIGEDICAGEMILPSYVTVSPAAIGAMLAGGVLFHGVAMRPPEALEHTPAPICWTNGAAVLRARTGSQHIRIGEDPPSSQVRGPSNTGPRSCSDLPAGPISADAWRGALLFPLIT